MQGSASDDFGVNYTPQRPKSKPITKYNAIKTNSNECVLLTVLSSDSRLELST